MDMSAILSETEKRSGGAKIVSQEHDIGKIRPSGPAGDPYEHSMTQAAAVVRANVNIARGKVSVMSVKEVPWHGLGVVIDKAANGREAIEHANLAGWGLEKIQQYVDFQDKRLDTDRWAIVRGDTGKFLSSVGSDYKIVTNEEGFEFMDGITDFGAVYETAGALGKGQRVWILAAVPELTTLIAGNDELKAYVMFTLYHGYGSIKCFPTDVRTACQNAYNRAYEKDGRRGLSFRHTKNVKANMEAAKQSLLVAKERCKEFSENAEVLAKVKMDDSLLYFNACLDDILDVTVAGQKLKIADPEQHKNVLKAILDISEIEKRFTEAERLERAMNRRAGFLDEILERHESERCNGNRNIAGTAWSAMNAVTETMQHTDKFRFRGEERVRLESRMDSVMEGRAAAATDIAMEKAMALAV